MYKKIAIICLFCFGCSPIASNVSLIHEKSHLIQNQIESKLQPGDVIFRLGETIVAGLNFSQLVAKMSDSDFSHAVIVYAVEGNEAIVADVTPNGLQRFYLVDWLMEGQENIVVKRLKPEYRHYIPIILSTLKTVIQQDPLYDINFKDNSAEFYCVELVDYCFRQSGLPLSNLVPVNQMPSYNNVSIVFSIASAIKGFDLSTPVVIAGNDEIGLFSSPFLETVIDLR